MLTVDAKTPMGAFLDAMEATDERQRREKLQRKAQTLRDRIRELSQKSYWEQFERSPEFLIMFVPNEASINAAFEQDCEILDYAMRQRVLIASPVTLLALLKAVAYGWQQQTLADNARRIAELAKDLYRRLRPFIAHLQAG